jgi:hypothetical protein
MSTNNTAESLVVRSVAERVLSRHGYGKDQVHGIKFTQCEDGKMQFDVELTIPMDEVNIRFVGAQNRKPELVMCHDDEL